MKIAKVTNMRVLSGEKLHALPKDRADSFSPATRSSFTQRSRGNALVEFVLVLPWLVGAVLALVWLSVWVMQGHLMHYAAYKKARLLSLYQTEKAQMEAETIYPKPIITNTPIHFSLNGIQLDLSSQDKEDRWYQPAMDNPIPFCGSEGSYALCNH